MARFLSAFTGFWIALFAQAAFASADDLTQINAYLNNLLSAKAQFIQTNADGTNSTGSLSLQRPGRARFDYDPPEGAVVMIYARAIYIYDEAGDARPEVYPIGNSPFEILLRRNIDLTDPSLDTQVKPLQAGRLLLRVQNAEDLNAGALEMVFTQNPMRLQAWLLHNETGEITLVELQDLEENVNLDSQIFKPEEMPKNNP